MQITNQEYRHAALMAAIVAIVPLIFFPNSLGLKINVSPFLFFLFELAYYWVIFAVFMKGAEVRSVFISGTITFFVRLGVGCLFAILVLITRESSVKMAFAAGLFDYKPAMFLQVISIPFILMTILRAHLGIDLKEKTPFVMQTLGQTAKEEEESPTRPEVKKEDFSDRKIIGLKTQPVAEKPATGFEDAIRYVGELAAVRFAILVDNRGLPVAFHGDDKSARNLWSAISIYLVDKIREPLARAGSFDLEGFELTLDLYRIHVVKIEELFLFVAADKVSGETEKVRIAQAANMIKKFYHERYSAKPETSAREESYVPSFS